MSDVDVNAHAERAAKELRWIFDRDLDGTNKRDANEYFDQLLTVIRAIWQQRAVEAEERAVAAEAAQEKAIRDLRAALRPFDTQEEQ